MKTLRQSIENGERGIFVTNLYYTYQVLRSAGNMTARLLRVADRENTEKLKVAFPGCEKEDGDPLFLARKLEEQYPALLHLDDDTENPHQFEF